MFDVPVAIGMLFLICQKIANKNSEFLRKAYFLRIKYIFFLAESKKLLYLP